MPGTIATAVLKRVREDHDNIPLLNLAYEGQGDSQTITRLEAFMHQARSYQYEKGVSSQVMERTHKGFRSGFFQYRA